MLAVLVLLALMSLFHAKIDFSVVRINILMRTNKPLQLSLNLYFMHILSIQSYHLPKTVGKSTCKWSSGTP